MENITNQYEQERAVLKAVRLTSVDQVSQMDWRTTVDGLVTQVSDLIANYLQQHPSEMLAKNPDVIKDQFLSGKSVMIVSEYFGKPTVLYHGFLYPAFKNGESKHLGFQIIELGSAIAHPDFRGRFGLGTQGTLLRLQRAREIWGNFIGISTIKQTATYRALRHAGMVKDDFWQNPYLSFLTCSCQNSSERYNKKACEFRQGTYNTSGLDAVEGSSQKIPCTLMVSGSLNIKLFEEKCRKVHEEILGESLVPGVINPETMSKANQFFELLNNSGADKMNTYALGR